MGMKDRHVVRVHAILMMLQPIARHITCTGRGNAGIVRHNFPALGQILQHVIAGKRRFFVERTKIDPDKAVSFCGWIPRLANGVLALAAVTLSPDNRFVTVADLGLDQVLSYRIDATSGGLGPNPAVAKTTPGAGPRHLAFRTDGKFMYVLNEISSTVTTYKYDARNAGLEALQTLSTLPEGFTGKNTTAEIALDPQSHFLYASNRGHDSIAIFSVDAMNGTLTALDRVPTGGKTPRNFAIDPAGKFLFAANQDTSTVMTFRINPKTSVKPLATRKYSAARVTPFRNVRRNNFMPRAARPQPPALAALCRIGRPS